MKKKNLPRIKYIKLEAATVLGKVLGDVPESQLDPFEVLPPGVRTYRDLW
jgi:hypothetical protein